MSLAESKKTRTLGFILLTALALTLLSTSACAKISLDGIDIILDDTTLDVGDELIIENITLLEPDDTENDVEVTVEILINGVQVHSEDVEIDLEGGKDYELGDFTDFSSRYFKNEDGEDVWGKNLMGYTCNSKHKMTVKLSGGVTNIEKTVNFKISGEEFYRVTVEPAKPSANDDIKIKVKDKNGNDMKGANVRLTWLDDTRGIRSGEWDKDDLSRESTTDRYGEVEFNIAKDFGSKATGAFQLDVWDDDYCLERSTFTISNELKITTTPESATAGQDVKICVTDANGGKITSPGIYVYAVGGGYSRNFVGDTNGCTTTSFTTPASYSITATKSGYDESYGTLIVTEKPLLTVTPSKTTSEPNEELTLTVRSIGQPVSGATITASKVGGSQEILSLKTDTNGRITYTPKEPGSYTLTAEKTGYNSGTTNIRVEDSFKITAPQNAVQVGDPVEITVKDMKNNPVAQAAVRITQAGVDGLTDANGAYTFTPKTPGAYQIIVEKTGFTVKTANIEAHGNLNIIVQPAEIDVGGKSTITVTDLEGIKQVAQVKVTDPQGQAQTSSGATIDVTASTVGTYEIAVSKQYYQDASAQLTVKPRPLTVKTEVVDKNLVLNAASAGSPVPDLDIEVTLPDATKVTVKTNSNGIATIDASQPGTYLISIAEGEYAGLAESVERPRGLLEGRGMMLIAIVVVAGGLIIIIIVAVILAGHAAKPKGAKPSFQKAERSSGRTKLGGL